MDRKGFTLIELLIVVVIIGILAAIAIPRFGETRERAYVSAMQSDLNQVRTAQEMCYQDGEDCSGTAFTYADELSTLTDADLYTPTDGVTIEITSGDGTSWAATADHTSTDQQCTYDSTVGTIDCAVP